MIIDGIDFDELPTSSEEAFVIYEKQARKQYAELVHSDRNYPGHNDQNGDYIGDYEPEKSYVTSIIAFIDEYNLDVDVPDISDFMADDYYGVFLRAKSKIEYAVSRFVLRKNRIDTGSAGTVITITSSYKSEIGSLLDTISKIVNQEIKDVKKRDKIFTKLSSLRSEIDREQTTVDAIFGRMIDFSQTVGTCADELEPLFNKMERLKKIFWDHTDKVDLLPKRARQKLIPDQSEGSNDDEIPF